MNNRINQVISRLQGSNSTLEEQAQNLGFKEKDLTTEELDTLDESLFVCDACSWWCSTEEVVKESTFCAECREIDRTLCVL